MAGGKGLPAVTVLFVQTIFADYIWISFTKFFSEAGTLVISFPLVIKGFPHFIGTFRKFLVIIPEIFPAGCTIGIVFRSAFSVSASWAISAFLSLKINRPSFSIFSWHIVRLYKESLYTNHNKKNQVCQCHIIPDAFS